MAPTIDFTRSASADTAISAAVGDANRSSANRLKVKNVKDDVKAVQTLLKRMADTFPVQTDRKRPYSVDPGRVNGNCGTRTIGAIDNLQRWFFGSSDGRIAPDGKTLSYMCEVLAGEFSMHIRPATNKSLVSLMQEKKGQVYFFGARVPKWNQHWRGPWDCAELVAWGLNLTCGGYLGDHLIGCRKKARGFHDAHTGHFLQDLKSLSKRKNPKNAKQMVTEEVDFGYAKKTAGVIGVKKGHIYVSAGNGTTIEAKGGTGKRAVREMTVRERRKYSFWKVNLMAYL